MTTQINLPRDAEGREIPLNTLLLYDKDGNELNVKRIEFDTFNKKWAFVVQKGSYDGILIRFHPQEVYLTQPDSWEKLLDDLKNVSKATNRSLGATCCIWFNDGKGCVDCPAGEVNDETCGSQFVNDIAARIRKLRGEE